MAFLFQPGKKEPIHIPLGPNELGRRAPMEVAESFDRFEWTFTTEGGTPYFTLRIFDSNGRPVATVREHAMLVWEPTPDQVEAMGTSILWELTAYDAAGTELDSEQWSSRLSSSD